jgi:hypothetical protein
VEVSCEDGNVPLGSIKVGKLLNGCTTGGFSRKAQLREVELRLQRTVESCEIERAVQKCKELLEIF